MMSLARSDPEGDNTAGIAFVDHAAGSRKAFVPVKFRDLVWQTLQSLPER